MPKAKEIRKDLYDLLTASGLDLTGELKQQIKHILKHHTDAKLAEMMTENDRLRLALERKNKAKMATTNTTKRSSTTPTVEPTKEKELILVQPDSFAKPTGPKKIRIF